MSSAPQPASPAPVRPHTLWRHWWKVGLVLLVLIALLIGAGLWYGNTPQFKNRVRQKVVDVLETATGGRVELGAFRWRLLRLEFEADNLTIHGLEPAGQLPYAHVDRLFVRAKILSLFRTKIGLNYLEADHPVIHIIVYPDGSTNQPHPKVENPNSGSVTDTIFDLQVNRALLNDGVTIFNEQAMPFNAAANNVGIKLQYTPAPLSHPTQDRYEGSIHIEDLTTQRGAASPIHSLLDAELQLERNSASLPSFTLRTASFSLMGRAALQNFSDPQWKATVNGDVDLRMAQVLAAIPGLEKGTAQIQLTGQGTKNTFTIDGQSKVTDGAYRNGTVHLFGVNAKTAVHVTQDEVTLTNAQAKLPGGGTVDGSLRIVNWLNSAPPAPEKPLPRSVRAGRNQPIATTGQQEQGTVRARVSGMTVTSILSMVAPPRSANLGFASIASGPVSLDWKGSALDFVMDAKIALNAPRNPAAGEVPLNGSVDGQYINRSGLVNIRSFTAETPATHIQVTGALGVYPPTRPSQINVDLTTTNLAEFDRSLKAIGVAANGKTGVQAIPVALHGQAEFHGSISRSILAPDVKGHLTATNFDLVYSTIPGSTSPTAPAQHNAPATAQPVAETTPAVEHTIHWDSLSADAEYAPELISVRQASLVHGSTTIHASGTIHAHQLTHHHLAFDEESPLEVDAAIHNAPLTDLLQTAGESLPVTGTVNLEVHASGQLNNLGGGGHLSVQGGEIYSQPYRGLTTDLRFLGREIDATHLVFLEDGGKIQGQGAYNLSTEVAQFSAQGSGFDLAHIKQLQNDKYPVSGVLGFEAHGSGTLKNPNIEANLHLKGLNLANATTGYIDASAHTQSGQLLVDMNGHMTNAVFQGHGQVQLSGDYQANGRVSVTNLDIDPLLQTFNVQGIRAHSSIAGALTVSGPLSKPASLGGDASINEFSLSLVGVPLKTEGPLHATLINGRLHLDPFHVIGDDTDLHAQGSIGIFGGARDLDLHGNGSINMKLVQTVDSDITASGHVDFNVDAVGTFQRPSLTGQVKFTNVAMALQDFPNGLSQMNGTLNFDQDRLDVKSLTATSGGGKIQLGGFITYQQGLYGDLTATAKDVRIRYPQGVSSMADARLRLQGTQDSLLLSGNVTITRFIIGSDLDLAALTSVTSVSLPPDPNAPSSHVRLDVHIVSAPQLDFQNSYAKLAGDVDMRVRGTLAQPSLLGHIAITEGSATFAGTKYELQRGDIYFTNPVRIAPLIDITATAHVEDYDITIGLNGTPDKLQPTFRSEPPLSEQDIFALLAMGRTQEEQQIYTMQQQQAGVNTTADALLGGALNATVSSRIEKLFGGGSVKIDPNYVSGTGNSSARITVEQQVAKNATLTYATNINSTAQQLIQGQVNITRDFSIIAVRDESGVFSLIFKIRRRYK